MKIKMIMALTTNGQVWFTNIEL